MSKRPYINGVRDVIRCPSCKAFRVNRRFKSCGNCGVGLKFSGEFVYEGDYFWHEGKWIAYDELLKMSKS